MKPKIYAMIPARYGSQRLRLKNLALIQGKPLIYYAIQAAKKSNCFNKIIINSDHKIFSNVAKRYKVEFYKRPKQLGSSNTKSDDIIKDFFKKFFNCDIVVWVNPIAPLQESSEVKEILNFFVKKKIDSLFTVENKKIHSNFNKKPLNYIMRSKFAKTQDLKEVQLFVYSLMIWRKKSFLKEFKKSKKAFFCGKTFFYPVKKMSTIIVKNIEDLKLADYLMKSKSKKFVLKYDKILQSNKSKQWQN